MSEPGGWVYAVAAHHNASNSSAPTLAAINVAGIELDCDAPLKADLVLLRAAFVPVEKTATQQNRHCADTKA
jgi:hypothetical protein